MVGQGVLRECLLDRDVAIVETIGRSPSVVQHAKAKDVVRADLFDYGGSEDALRGFDACFFCLGVSSAGITEAEYERLTYGLTLAAARKLVALNPCMTFTYVSGMGTDGSEKGRTMWARVKGRTENALLQLPFKAAYMFRPGFIQPIHGEQSRTAVYRILYRLSAPLLPLLRRIFPRQIVTTEDIGRAMLQVAKRGAPTKILEPPDILECSREYCLQEASVRPS